MVSAKILALIVVAVAAIGGIAFITLPDGGDEEPDIPDDPVGPVDPVKPGDSDDPTDPVGPVDPVKPEVPETSGHYVPADDLKSTDWSQWLGGTSTQGVSDSRTPIKESQMRELWNHSGVSEGAMVWKVPGTPVCVGEKTYYHDGTTGKVRCVETLTGRLLAEGPCQSSSMYNMPLAYGDGKIFVPTSTGTATVFKALDADTLEQLFVSSPVPGGQVQGPISYHDGKVLFGTYSGEFACFSSEDTDKGRGNETVSPMWTMDGAGWYNCIPAFFGDDCVIVDKGFSKESGTTVRASETDKPGAILYLIDSDTGSVRDSLKIDMEFSLSGAAAYKDRVYVALTPNNGNYVTEGFKPTEEVRVHSFVVDNGDIVDSSEKIWKSGVKGAGTQAIPVFFNDRMYLAGGGATMGSAQPISVVDIDGTGNMTTAYTADVFSKSSVVLSTGYATPENGNTVYMYVIEYGHVYEGEAADSTSGYADIFCLSDRESQKSPKIEFQIRPSVPQFAFQSFTISPEGCLLVKNDLCLFCYGSPDTAYRVADVKAQMELAIEGAGTGKVQTVILEDVLSRYNALQESDRVSVKAQYDEMTSQVCRVIFRTGDGDITVDVLRNGYVQAPAVADRPSEMFSGWRLNGTDWDSYTDPVIDDISLEAVFVPAAKVVLDAADGSSTDHILAEKGSPMGYVSDPVRNGWFFDGWYSGEKEYIPQFSVVESDTELKAHWLKVSRLSFYSDGGSDIASKEVVHTHAVGTLETPFRAGYEFAGWFYGDVQYTAETVYPYEKDITLKAVWTENPEKTVKASNADVRVTGNLPEGVTITLGEKPEVGVASVKALRTAVGPTGELFLLNVFGGGIDGSQRFTLEFDVTGMDGREFDVYYYIKSGPGEDPLHKTAGKVENGVFSVDLFGKTSSKGIQVDFALDGALKLSQKIDKEA